LHAARAQYLVARETPEPAPRSRDAWAEAAAFEAALLAGHQRQAAEMMTGCMDRGHSLVDIELHVVQPAL
jgi:hypothetical protein